MRCMAAAAVGARILAGGVLLMRHVVVCGCIQGRGMTLWLVIGSRCLHFAAARRRAGGVTMHRHVVGVYPNARPLGIPLRYTSVTVYTTHPVTFRPRPPFQNTCMPASLCPSIVHLSSIYLLPPWPQLFRSPWPHPPPPPHATDIHTDTLPRPRHRIPRSGPARLQFLLLRAGQAINHGQTAPFRPSWRQISGPLSHLSEKCACNTIPCGCLYPGSVHKTCPSS